MDHCDADRETTAEAPDFGEGISLNIMLPAD